MADVKKDSYRWTEYYMKQMIRTSYLKKEELAQPNTYISKGEFLHWLLRCLPPVGTEQDHDAGAFRSPLDQHPYAQDVLKAVEHKFIDAEESFDPDQLLMRSLAGLWLIRAKGGEKLEELARSMTNPVVPAQDGFDEITEASRGIIAMAVHPDYQLLGFRWKSSHNYRYIETESPLTRAEAAVSLYHLLNPPKKGGAIAIAQNEPLSKDLPGWFCTESSHQIQRILFQKAIGGSDAQGSFFPVLIQKIPTQDNGLWKINDDGSMELTFQLRPGIYWSDGTPITAEDALFSFNFRRQLGYLPSISEVEGWIDHIEAKDHSTFTVYWQKPYRWANLMLDLYPGHKEEELKQFFLSPSLDKVPVHAGPYTFHALKPNGLIELRSNPFYVLGEPLIDRIQIISESDPTKLQNLAQNQELDLVLPGLMPIELPVNDFSTYDTFQALAVPTLHWEHIDLAMDHTFLNDPSVRQALLHSIDRISMLNDLSLEGYQLSHSLLPPFHPSYPDALLQKYPYDPQKAKQLLESAGWTRNASTHQWKKNGQTLNIALISIDSKKHPERIRVKELIAKEWQDIGIQIELEEIHPNELTNRILMKRQNKEAFAILYRWEFTPHSNFYTLLHSTMIPSQANAYRGQNYTGFQHELTDELLTESFRTMDSQRIIQLTGSLQEILSKELPVLPLYHPQYHMLVHRNLKGATSAFYHDPILESIIYWYWDF